MGVAISYVAALALRARIELSTDATTTLLATLSLMPTNVLMPQLGESIVEGTLVRWNKRVGEKISRDEPLFEISTDKVDAEIPSPSAGVLIKVLVSEGQTVPVDSVVAVIESVGEVTAIPLPTVKEDSAQASKLASVPEVTSHETAGIGRASLNRSQISPVVRKMLREHALDAGAIRGTGTGGRVTKDDVLRHLDSVSSANTGDDRSESMSVMRRQIAEHMVRSRRISAHVHTVFDVDFSEVERIRAVRNVELAASGTKLTYLPFIAKAVVDAVPEVPIVNATIDGDRVIYRDDVNLGIAVSLDEGLIVPIIKQAQKLTFLQIVEVIVDLSDRARTKRLDPADVKGGTLTITNPGASGSIFGLPIINQPQLAIVCVGAIEKRPVVVDDTVVIRSKSYLTLGFDHRVIDGAVADQFMVAVKRNLEHFDHTLV